MVRLGPPYVASDSGLGWLRTVDMERGFERVFERCLFAARWLAAPVYVGLILALGILLVILGKYFSVIVADVPTADLHNAVIMILSLIDLALIANLVLIVLFTGYDSFVSRLDIDGKDRPGWLGKVDFSGLKLKLFASIVAITGIELLKAFMDLSEAGQTNERRLIWLVVIHVVFLVTTIGAAFTQWLSVRAKSHS